MNTNLDNVFPNCTQITDGIVIADLIARYNTKSQAHESSTEIGVCVDDVCVTEWHPNKTHKCSVNGR